MAIDDSDLGATVLGYAAGQKVFQRFTLKKMLGRGGMGVVWLAVDDKLEREVALKFLPEVMKSDRPAMEELKRETRRALDLTHSNIVRFYDFVENETTAAISMEYIPGDTLSGRRLAQPGQFFEPPALRRWVRQLCEALAYAHERGAVVHRDLKPANLLVDAHGDIKVTDFGIARSISDSVSRISAQASTSGTPAYMSPQQMMGERPHPTDDIYSFGATLYELLTGKPPFYSGNIPAQVQSKVPPSIAARRKELGITGGPIPPEWEATIAACLAKDVKQRPQTVRELAQRLGLPMATQTLSPFGDGQTHATQPGGAPARPRRWWPAAVVAALALAAAGYYLGVVLPDREAAERERQRLAAEARQAEEVRKIREANEAAEAQRQLAARQQEDEAKRMEEARQAREQRETNEARLAIEAFRKRLRNGDIPLAELKAIAQEQTFRGRMARERLEELRNEQETADLKAHGQVLQLIDRLADNAPRAALDDTDRQVRAYLADAPEKFRADVSQAWLRRQTAWKNYETAHAPGTLTVTTQPANTLVTLLPRNERKPSPAVFTNIPPGPVTLHVEREGFEPRDVPLTIQAGTETKPETVRLTPFMGSAYFTSTPAGVKFTLEAGGRVFEGITPRRFPSVPQGRYRVTFQREGWDPVQRIFEVSKDKETPVDADLRGATFDIRSTPAGGRVILNGREVGVTPLTLADMKLGDYRLDILCDGYENYAEKVSATGNVALNITLTETPVTAILRQLAAHRWVTESGAHTELSFDASGNVHGTQSGVFSGSREVAGRVESYDAANRKLTIVFTQGDTLSGRLPLQVIDERSFRISVVNQLGFTSEIVFTDQGAGGNH